MKALIQQLRAQLLHGINRRRLAALMAGVPLAGRLPVFVIASPPDMHLAPLAVLTGHPRIVHIIVGNGISAADVTWLKSQSPDIPVVQLMASLQGNARSYLAHAEVVRLCQQVSPGDFCIQDADCFVTDTNWWEQLRFTSAHQYAAGPFGKPLERLDAQMPDTYLVLINGATYRQREGQGIRPDIATVPVPALQSLLKARGLTGAYFPDIVKTYYDTLQMHWTAATIGGEEFLHLPGENQIVFHVGGSTYLNGKACADVTHWDYWPLNTPYFHMRVLETPRFAAIRPRFAGIFERYGSPQKVLEQFPDFKKSQRYQLSEKLLADFKPYLNT